MSAATRPRKRRDPALRHGILGIVAILLGAAIGYVAYTANRGLPFQHMYEINVNVPNADRLINTADVRIGGIRVGSVLGVTAEAATAARGPYTRLHVALNRSVAPLPVDTTSRVRPASVLGLTYLDLVRGHSARTVPAGGTLPLRNALSSSDLTDLLNIFDRSSARHFHAILGNLAQATAGRGQDINTTISAVNRLLAPLTDVASALSAPPARLHDFLRAYEQLSSALAPVSGRLGSLISRAATTFDALAGARGSLAATIDAAPGAESAATTAFTAVRPALDGLSRLVVDLRPAGRILPATLARINTTLYTGERPLRELPPFARDLQHALGTLQGLSRDPNTAGSLRKLADLASASRGALSVLVPAQVNCTVISLFTSGFAGVFGTLGTGDGPSLGALFLEDTGAKGENFQNARPSPDAGINPIPNENQSECEAGNEPWSGKQQLGNPAGLQSNTTRPTVPPPGVPALAAGAGLLTTPEGLR